MQKKILLVGICAGVMMAAAVQAQAQWFLFSNPLLGKQAQEFTLRDLDGNPQTLSGLREGRPAILFFWATWCPYCVKQLVEIKKNAELFERSDTQLILVDLGEDARKVKRFLDRLGLSFNVLLDEDGRVSSAYGVKGIPVYVLINKDGIIKAVEHVLPRDHATILGES